MQRDWNVQHEGHVRRFRRVARPCPLRLCEQTAVINVIRAHLAEFGIVAPVGRKGVEELLNVVTDASDKRVPAAARMCLAALGAQLRRLKEQIWSSTV